MNKNLSIITINQPDITNFSRLRNQAMKQAKTNWVLFLDADEKLSSKLKAEINKVTLSDATASKNVNYQLKRLDVFLGKKLYFGETAQFCSTRLIQKGSGQWQGKVHEKFNSKLPLKTLKHPLIHNRQLTINQFIERLNNYTSIRAQELSQLSLFQLLFYPPLKFIQNYIFRLGFLDGYPGLIMAFSMSLHSLMVRVKVYEKTTQT